MLGAFLNAPNRAGYDDHGKKRRRSCTNLQPQAAHDAGNAWPLIRNRCGTIAIRKGLLQANAQLGGRSREASARP